MDTLCPSHSIFYTLQNKKVNSPKQAIAVKSYYLNFVYGQQKSIGEFDKLVTGCVRIIKLSG